MPDEYACAEPEASANSRMANEKKFQAPSFLTFFRNKRTKLNAAGQVVSIVIDDHQKTEEPHAGREKLYLLHSIIATTVSERVSLIGIGMAKCLVSRMILRRSRPLRPSP